MHETEYWVWGLVERENPLSSPKRDTKTKRLKAVHTAAIYFSTYAPPKVVLLNEDFAHRIDISSWDIRTPKTRYEFL